MVKKIAVTGAAGQIAYSLLFRIARGEVFGSHQPIDLHLIDLPEMVPALEGIAMELEDCAFPLLRRIKITGDLDEGFELVDLVFLVGAKPRGPGMERKDLLLDNGKIFIAQGQALNRMASRDVRVLVVGNPCNTNCLIALHHAPDLSPSQFFAMTALDHNRATQLLAKKSHKSVQEVSNMIIWGNHSSTQVPDASHARIQERSALDVIGDRKWLEHEFITSVQQRGAEVIRMRGKSSAASAANAALDAARALYTLTPPGHWFSMALYTRGNPYGIREDLIFSFPCRSTGHGDAHIVPHLSTFPFIQEKIALTTKELIEEREVIAHLLH